MKYLVFPGPEVARADGAAARDGLYATERGSLRGKSVGGTVESVRPEE